MNSRSFLILIVLASAVFLADRVTKMAVESSMVLYQSKEVLGDFFRFTYVRNPGGAFGTRLGGNLFYIVSALIAIALVFTWLFRKETGRTLLVAISLMLGGALGNLYDRILAGTVVDFFDFGVGQIRWPTFNIADSAITVGIVLVIIDGLFIRKDGQETKKP